ncbi:50S ribosomal protein L4 [Candidatus Azambacteria bacterium RIFOXYD1_FULL_42_11]|uniref:Large ribosomal subunit protein uL4 n=1 Tax=Candidatus Azambacteria bacterium RIFOXYD1_FULL_42_11 TaxID=1797310 RepID=A0A1F5CGJ7_9BACT|nr:MAG: 50S ribosomal protein L4 [Candidatus Azambacteria bacterium RIFOXYD1_FULL_42_11]
MSIAIKVYNQEGKEVLELGLNEAIFGLPWNADLVHQVVRVSMANKRPVLASTKDRAQVSGGGKKPWKQKGTGRARHGSIRSPLWRHGGITFGPTSERNFKLNINKKMARKAFLIALSAKAKDNELLVLDDLKLKTPKTKEMAMIMKNFPKIKNSLLVTDGKDETIKKAAGNLPNLEIANINNLNILDILKYQYLILTKEGVEYLNKKYAVAK